MRTHVTVLKRHHEFTPKNGQIFLAWHVHCSCSSVPYPELQLQCAVSFGPCFRGCGKHWTKKNPLNTICVQSSVRAWESVQRTSSGESIQRKSSGESFQRKSSGESVQRKSMESQPLGGRTSVRSWPGPLMVFIQCFKRKDKTNYIRYVFTHVRTHHTHCSGQSL